jgi:hypothetical protein
MSAPNNLGVMMVRPLSRVDQRESMPRAEPPSLRASEAASPLTAPVAKSYDTF